MQYVGGRSDRITAKEQWQTALFRSKNQAPSGGFVTVNVGVNARFCLVAFDAVGRYRSVYVVTIVVAALNHLGISLVDGRLLGKLVFEHVQCSLERAVEQPAHQAECKHVAALQRCFVVESAIGKRSLHHRGHWHLNNLSPNLCKPDFIVRLVGGVKRLVEVRLAERIDVDDSHTAIFQEFHVLLQCCSVHRHEHVALVARSVHTASDVHLKSRYAIKRALWSTHLCRIVGEGGNLVANASRHIREDVASQLHAIARVARETHHYLVKHLDILFF